MEKKTKYHSINRDYLIQAVQQYKKPFTAKELSDSLHKANAPLSTSTIYRLLDEFVTDGALRKSYAEDNTAKYFYVEPCNDDNHFYLECSKCHRIYHLDCKHLHTFAKHISKKHNFEISNYNLTISGLCSDCKE